MLIVSSRESEKPLVTGSRVRMLRRSEAHSNTSSFRRSTSKLYELRVFVPEVVSRVPVFEERD